MIRIWLVALVVLASLGVGARPASAEWFADLFAGLSLTRDHDLKLNDQGIGQGTYESVEFDRSLAWGGRFGRYFDSVPFVAEYAVEACRRAKKLGKRPRKGNPFRKTARRQHTYFTERIRGQPHPTRKCCFGGGLLRSRANAP